MTITAPPRRPRSQPPTPPRRRRRRPGGSSVASSPVLIGAVTVLVVLVAVFLAYNANNGLPFVPTRQLKVDLPNGDELVKGNDVREGGLRIGFVSAMTPVRLHNGNVVAQATLSLDKSAGAFPVNSVAIVRPQSALGLEYLELDRGTAHKAIADGGTLPVGQTQSEPELDQVLSTFDVPTRDAARTNLSEFGNAFAGRGPDLSTTLQLLPGTLPKLTAVAGNLASPSAHLSNLFPQLDTTAGVIAPIAGTFSHLFSTLADTFAAIDQSPSALRDTIASTPSTLAVGATSLATQRPFLNDSARLLANLAPATHELRAALPTLDSALVVGTAVTKRTPVLYSNLQQAVAALKSLALAPMTNAALRALTATVNTVQPQLRYLGPYITVCNYWTTFFTFAAESQSAPAPGGQALRALINTADPLATNSYMTAGATLPANGGGGTPGMPKEYLHAQPYGAAVTNSGAADCEYGQRGYTNRSPNAPAGYNEVTDPHNEVGYAAGPTYQTYTHSGPQGLGPTRVPAGETFTREPGGLGAQLQSNLQGSP